MTISKETKYLAVAVLLILIAIPIIYYSTSGNNKTNTTPMPTTSSSSSMTTSSTVSSSISSTTTTSSSTTTTPTTEAITTTSEITSTFMTTETITNQSVITHEIGTPIMLPNRFDQGSLVETDVMYGISVASTTIENQYQVNIADNIADFGEYKFFVETISGAPAQEVFKYYTSTSLVQKELGKILNLPENMVFTEFDTINGTIIGKFTAEWPDQLGGAIEGEVTFATPVSMVGTYTYTITEDGVINTGYATIYLTGNPENVYTTFEGTFISTITITSITSYETSEVYTTTVVSTITH